ncbi:LA2681 family HEPN domain-containing protein [Mucilaginibacter rubeus]|uniref:LA2681 family HEPN domain-containing protein n=1 Tax=Mucilaginibacter rubeus TaxID=2027860 RepID=UPI001666295D|nr:LA2681 family HEPN domain-containing protein [Mucilaginibacter rubeus]GGA95779.1 hypothetical protein GCM10011500_09450 [Mucilaginibacter rubeus]
MELKEDLTTITIEGKSQRQQIDIIGSLLDLSFDQKRLDGLEYAFNLSKQINMKALAPELQTLLFYDLANGWSYYRKIKYHESQDSWLFQMEELTKEIFYLRKAIASSGFSRVEGWRQSQIYTNLGNSFSFMGRFVEAQEYFQQALRATPDFAMSIGNMANGLFYYGRALYDQVHSNLFLVYAYHHFIQALKNKKSLHPDAASGFQSMHDSLRIYISSNFPDEYMRDYPELDNYDMGDDEELNKYRLWCLSNTLFINPLNDLGPHRIACHDCLNLPTVTLPANRPPVCLNLFNQIKQEYATARYSYYTSASKGLIHFSDLDTPLVETMEMVRYSYYVEQLKIAFRLSYSILDKIAYLLNDYMGLNIELNKVSFRSLWYINKKRLQAPFEESKNWALRGLFWLSKDLYEKDSDFDTVLEPDAKEIAAIRNYIEHKGFKVVSDTPEFSDGFKEPDISYSISRSAFEQKTMKLLKLTRAAIMYSAIAISHEESVKEFDKTRSLPIGSATIPAYMRT